MQQEKQTLLELFAGIALGVVLLLLGNFLADNQLAYSLGLLLGGVTAVIMSSHMYASIGEAILYDQKTAEKKIKFASLLRMFFMVAALVAAALLPEVFSFLAVVLGISTLKFSAYLQPLTHKVFNKILNKGR